MIEAFFSEHRLKHSTFSRHGHAVAWGLDPKRGRLVAAPGVTQGAYAGGQYGKALVAVDELCEFNSVPTDLRRRQCR